MVRLVFRPYTQVWRTICTSVPLRASIRVSPDFTLLRHSSPSFGSVQQRSYSNLSPKIKVGRLCKNPICYFHCAYRFATHILAVVDDSLVRVSRRVEKNHFVIVLQQNIITHCSYGRNTLEVLHSVPTIMPPWNLLALLTRGDGLKRRTRNTAANLRPYTDIPETPKLRWLQITRNTTGTPANYQPYGLDVTFVLQQSYNEKLVSFASLSSVSRTFNPLSKVLFTFPSRYLFAIGLESIFSFRRKIPPI